MTRQFLVTVLAVLLGAGVALWGYDRFVPAVFGLASSTGTALRAGILRLHVIYRVASESGALRSPANPVFTDRR